MELLFVLGDVLPTIYDVAISIFTVASNPTTDKMADSINAYVTSLIQVWTKAFGAEYVQCRRTVKEKVQIIVGHYYNNVYVEHTRTKPKKKNMVFVKKSIRQLNREWMNSTIPITKKQRVPIDQLFDIGVNMDKLKGDEKSFYENSTGARLRGFRLSQEVDIEYAAKQARAEEERRQILEREAAACDDSDDTEEVSADVDLDMSTTRSGKKRVLTEDFAAPHESDPPPKKLRQVRNCTPESKSTCVALSVNCMMSTEMARVAFQTVCSKYYGHHYYLSREEAIEKDPSLAADSAVARSSRRKSTDKLKIPTTKDDYQVYENVIPSSRSLNDHKQVLAIQHERETALALHEIPPGTKVTLHFDATSRSKIDGDWPSLIFIFSDKRRFNLRPLFFAYEDRAQIIRLLVETFQRLSATIKQECPLGTAKSLWEKITAIMTDSVEKNLRIEEGAAEQLQSEHVPLHLLCKSHPVEAFDRSNLSVLAEIEKKVKFRESLETINPAVRSFLRGKSVVECAITSILSLISHDKSASSTNQAELFDHILEREGVVKHIAMYYERRFTKLGYSAASILEALPYLRMLLDETHLSNQHVEIVRMFLDAEFLITELHVLAFFTHKITLPFLYFVEVNTQEDLLDMFPKLFGDLKVGKMDTLQDYIVEYTHVQVRTPTEEIASNILNLMCIDAANVLERQAGREYGFGKFVDEPARATQLHLLTPDERADLPTNNLDSERNLTVFGKRAPLAKFRNKKFTAKGIRNDCTLHHSETFHNVTINGFSTIVKLLNNMEKDWTSEQKTLHKKKILEKIEKGRQQSMYTDKCLQLCKGWGGPAVSVEELNSILKKNSDRVEKIVRTELSYYRDTHRSEIVSNPELFKLNKISYDQQLLNLCTLIAGKDVGGKYVSLPTNKDVAKVLSSQSDNHLSSLQDADAIEVGQNYVTLIAEGDKKTWYLATCVNIDDSERYEMEFLHRVVRSSNLKWKHPVREDVDTLTKESIISCVIDGEWDVSTDRNMTYTLRNHEYINQLVNDIT